MEKIKYILGDMDHAKEIQQYFEKFANFKGHYNFQSDSFAYFIDPDTGKMSYLRTDEWLFKALAEAGIFEELEHPYVRPEIQVIKGVPGREVIEFLESLGGKNEKDLVGYVAEYYYFIDGNGCICCESMRSDFFDKFDLEILTLPEKIEKPTLTVIKGDPDRGDEIIKLLQGLGGVNMYCLSGRDTDVYYYIDDSEEINCAEWTHNFFKSYELDVLTLPEKVEKPKLQVIQGELDRGADVIALLEGLGGSNVFHYWGNTTGAYYYLDSDKAIRWDHVDDDFFTDYDLEILSLSEKPTESTVFAYPNEEPMILEPFVTKVLVRTYHDPCWIPGFFFSEESDGDTNEYHIVGSSFSYDECVPYEGNEHLAYTSNDVRIE